ncbi:MAG: hypothetical protein R3B84_10335 [Zavarzinella sp.]
MTSDRAPPLPMRYPVTWWTNARTFQQNYYLYWLSAVAFQNWLPHVGEEQTSQIFGQPFDHCGEQGILLRTQFSLDATNLTLLGTSSGRFPNIFLPPGLMIPHVLSATWLDQQFQRDSDELLLVQSCEPCQILRLTARFQPVQQLAQYTAPPVVAHQTRAWDTIELQTFQELHPHPVVKVEVENTALVDPQTTIVTSSSATLGGYISKARRLLTGLFAHLSLRTKPEPDQASTAPTFLKIGDELPKNGSSTSILHHCEHSIAVREFATFGSVPIADWVELATAYDASQQYEEAAAIWQWVLWKAPRPHAAWAWGWLRAESKALSHLTSLQDVTKVLQLKDNPASARQLAALLTWTSLQPTFPATIQANIGEFASCWQDIKHICLPKQSGWQNMPSNRSWVRMTCFWHAPTICC